MENPYSKRKKLKVAIIAAGLDALFIVAFLFLDANHNGKLIPENLTLLKTLNLAGSLPFLWLFFLPITFYSETLLRSFLSSKRALNPHITIIFVTLLGLFIPFSLLAIAAW